MDVQLPGSGPLPSNPWLLFVGLLLPLLLT
jgi:hypothetical protein